MDLVQQYRDNAEEWRALEKLAAREDHRRRIAEIANTWLSLAAQRERMLSGERDALIEDAPVGSGGA